MRPEGLILTMSRKFPQHSTEYESDMWDLSTVKQQAMADLAEWRLKYGPVRYPRAVVHNIMYRLLNIECMWPDFVACFSGEAQCTSFPDAMEYITQRKLTFQRHYLDANAQFLILADTPACGVSLSRWVDDIDAAARGDNAAVLELEYAYWYYMPYCTAVRVWAALGLMGLGRRAAFTEVTGGDVGDLHFGSLQNVLECMNMLLSGRCGGGFKDAGGSEYNPRPYGPNEKYYPTEFPFLPPLWPSKPEATSI